MNYTRVTSESEATAKPAPKFTRLQIYFTYQDEVEMILKAAKLERRSVSFIGRDAMLAHAKAIIAAHERKERP
jgi:uncharacterized protein (DUF1778 family)